MPEVEKWGILTVFSSFRKTASAALAYFGLLPFLVVV